MLYEIEYQRKGQKNRGRGAGRRNRKAKQNTNREREDYKSVFSQQNFEVSAVLARPAITTAQYGSHGFSQPVKATRRLTLADRSNTRLLINLGIACFKRTRGQ